MTGSTNVWVLRRGPRTLKIAAACLLIVASFSVAAAPAAVAKTTSPSAACRSAMDHAENVISSGKDALGAVGVFLTATSASASRNGNSGIAGVTQFLNDQTAAMKTMSDSINALTPTVTAERTAYDAAAAKCRAGK